MKQAFIHQIVFTEEESNHINKVGWDQACKDNPRVRLHLDHGATCNDLNHYECVAVVQGTNDLEDIFRVGNGQDVPGVKYKIFLGKRAHSLSVGDLVEIEGGNYHLCAGVGFVDIGSPFSEAAK